MKEKAGPSLRALSRASLRITSAPRVSIKGGGRENIFSFPFSHPFSRSERACHPEPRRGEGPAFVVYRQPIFVLCRPAPPVKPDLRRRNGALNPTGDVPAKALPRPIESTHFGEPDVSPTLPSSVRAMEPPTRWLTPPPTTRLSACVESDGPTSTPRDRSARQVGATS